MVIKQRARATTNRPFIARREQNFEARAFIAAVTLGDSAAPFVQQLDDDPARGACNEVVTNGER